MKFKEKYTNETDKNKPENKDKFVLSDEVYIVGEVLDEIANKLSRIKL